MTPQLITPLIQLPLVDPQLLGQLLGTAALHPLHRSALLFPTPTSISLSTLHSMLHGEFSSCLILRGHSIDHAASGSSHQNAVPARCRFGRFLCDRPSPTPLGRFSFVNRHRQEQARAATGTKHG